MHCSEYDMTASYSVLVINGHSIFKGNLGINIENVL